MAGYIVANFRITNSDGFAPYVPAVLPTLQAHKAEILVADYDSEGLEGNPASITVVIRFESKEAARAWYDSPEYQSVLPLRIENSEGILVLVNGFVMP